MGDPLDVHFLQSRLYRKESLATRAGARKVPKELRNPLVQIAEVYSATIRDERG
jgi:hypothetical protein